MKNLALIALLACACQQVAAPPPAPVQKPEVFSDPLPPMPAGHPDLTELAVYSRAPRRLLGRSSVSRCWPRE